MMTNELRNDFNEGMERKHGNAWRAFNDLMFDEATEADFRRRLAGTCSSRWDAGECMVEDEYGREMEIPEAVYRAIDFEAYAKDHDGERWHVVDGPYEGEVFLFTVENAPEV